MFETGPHGCPDNNSCGGNGEQPNPGLINGAFDPEGSEWLAAELTTNDIYVDHGTVLDRRAPSGSLLETLQLAGGDGTGVGVNSKEEALYVAQSSGAVEVFTKVPPAPPAVVSEAVSAVTGESATLEAAIEPRSEPFENPTSYWFQYVSEAQFARAGFAGAPRTPVASLAPSFEVDTVAPKNVLGLSANTVYHYRVVADNGQPAAPGHPEPAVGAEGTFTTQATGAFGLPDGRQWEMVSPPAKHGAQLVAPQGTESPLQAAAAGGAIVYNAGSPTESEPAGNGSVLSVLSVRGGGGWSSRDLALPHTSLAETTQGEGRRIPAVLGGSLAGARAAVRPVHPLLGRRGATAVPVP